MKTCKPLIFSDTESAHEGTSNNMTTAAYDAASTEILIELGRSLYKLMFQLLLLIESDHKIAINIVNNLQQNEQMEDLSKQFMAVRGALLRCVDDAADIESLDTSTSTEGEITPTPSPCLPLNNAEFESTLNELIENQKWSLAIAHIRLHKKLSNISSNQLNLILGAPTLVGVYALDDCSMNNPISFSTNETVVDDLSIILNIYSQRLIKDRNGKSIFSYTQFCSLKEIIFH